MSNHVPLSCQKFVIRSASRYGELPSLRAKMFGTSAGHESRASMKKLADFALEQHRVYMLREFEVRPEGDVVCSAYAPSQPERIISARFPRAVLKNAWQENEDVSKLPWPLEVIQFQAVRFGKRFRFTLTCVDFHREWESDWPQLL